MLFPAYRRISYHLEIRFLDMYILRMWVTCSSFRLRPRLSAWRTVRLCLQHTIYTCTLHLMRNMIWEARHSPLTYACCFHMLRLFSHFLGSLFLRNFSSIRLVCEAFRHSTSLRLTTPFSVGPRSPSPFLLSSLCLHF